MSVEQLINYFTITNRGESTKTLYIKLLQQLYGKDKPFKSLAFLKKKDEIIDKLKDYKPNTKKTYLIAIVSALDYVKDKKDYKSLYKKYHEEMMELANKITEESQTVKPLPDNWVSWTDVLKHYEELKQKKDQGYDDLLKYVVLSLYVLVPPRRNLDYQVMNVVQKYIPSLPQDRNYFSITDRKFYFNFYKTAKSFDQQVLRVPDDLFEILTDYLKSHPILVGKPIDADTNTPLLVYSNGNELKQVNSITRILHKVFGKNVGSSMLRHSYLTHKYGGVINEMKDDAEKMSHSTETQREYVMRTE